ncbi:MULTISPECIES: ATP-binding protein [unclassified Streptomyces]|uniref:ATP-binding protein n=1 Tax=unclassified Streptomyces TaxID=2593676 RepID=UPI0019084324|nr:ATP-binding protein [Streptomyces sp. HSG2]
MADHLAASVTLPTDPASVSTARGYAVGTLVEWGLGVDTDAAETIRLVVSELATNAVRHTLGQSPSFTVELVLDRDEWLYVGVTDSHPRFPRRLPATGQQDNGRGMVIVRCAAAERGGRVRVKPTREGGKTVSIELPWTGPDGLAGGPEPTGRRVAVGLGAPATTPG